jgi:hypothetical protein
MNVPDYISPIAAHRVWQWDTTGLKSLCGEPWHPGQPLAARCRVYSAVTIVGRAEAAHGAPQANCTCGVYASKSLEHLRTTGYARYGIHGEVNLWGKVIEHERGWRAQLAYPKNLFLSPDALPFTLAEIQSRLKMLTTYRIDMFVADPKGNIPLWAKDAGYSPAGLDYLIERSKQYYDRRRQERTLKKGDRVAILGRGIAVVEQVDDSTSPPLARILRSRGHTSMPSSSPTEKIECPLCCGTGELTRAEILDRLGVKDFARVAQLSAEEAFRLLQSKHDREHQSAWSRFEAELAKRTAEIREHHKDELRSALSDRDDLTRRVEG